MYFHWLINCNFRGRNFVLLVSFLSFCSSLQDAFVILNLFLDLYGLIVIMLAMVVEMHVFVLKGEYKQLFSIHVQIVRFICKYLCTSSIIFNKNMVVVFLLTGLITKPINALWSH